MALAASIISGVLAKGLYQVAFRKLLEQSGCQELITEAVDEVIDLTLDQLQISHPVLYSFEESLDGIICDALKEAALPDSAFDSYETELLYFINYTDIPDIQLIGSGLGDYLKDKYPNNENYPRMDTVIKYFAPRYHEQFWKKGIQTESFLEIIKNSISYLQNECNNNRAYSEETRTELKDLKTKLSDILEAYPITKKDKFGDYYRIQRCCYEAPNESIVGDESFVTSYIDATTIIEDRSVLLMDQVENWFNTAHPGVLLLYGEPGHGKTTFCKHAVYEFATKKRFTKAKQVLQFPLNHPKASLVKDGYVYVQNVFKGEMDDDLLVKPSDCKDMLIFLDGYDEVKLLLSSETKMDTFPKLVDELNTFAKSYGIHFVITSRKNALSSDDLNCCQKSKYEFGPLTYEEQEEWCLARPECISYWRETLSPICSGEETDAEYKKNLHELLQTPFIFRMIVHQQYPLEQDAINKADLYENLFKYTMANTHNMSQEDIDDLNREYCKLAYDIWRNNEDTFLRKGDLKNVLLFRYHIKEVDTESEIEIGFRHRSFYQYYLALYLYTEMKQLDDVNAVKTFLSQLDERRLSPDILDFFGEIVSNKSESIMDKKAAMLLKTMDETECVIADTEKPRLGNSECSIYNRCNGIFYNGLSLSLFFSVADTFNTCTNVKKLINKYSCRGLVFSRKEGALLDLSNCDLTGARLIGADLHDVNLKETFLIRASLHKASFVNANMENTILVAANISEAKLEHTTLTSANLSNTDMSRSILDDVTANYADFSKSDLNRSYFTRAILQDSDFGNSYLFKTRFKEADLCRSFLAGSTCIKAYLYKADLTDANCTGTNFTHADFEDAKLIKTILVKANLSSARLVNANLTGANLTMANLSKACLNNADLTGTNLKYAFFCNTEMKGTKVSRKAWSQAIVVDVDETDIEWIPEEEE